MTVLVTLNWKRIRNNQDRFSLAGQGGQSAHLCDGTARSLRGTWAVSPEAGLGLE